MANPLHSKEIEKFVKTHKLKSDVHTNPRTATNLAMNISYDRVIAENNPFFNKKLEEYPESDYQSLDLYEMN